MLHDLHLDDGYVIFWIVVALIVGYCANNVLHWLWGTVLNVADSAMQWGIAASAAIGIIVIIAGGIALSNGWSPSW